jgi:hypothetical protein
MVYTHNGVSIPSQPQKNEILLFTGKWVELENIVLNEISLSHKDKYHIFSTGEKKRTRK